MARIFLVLALALTAFAPSTVSAQWASCSAAYSSCKSACKDSVASPQCPSWCADQYQSCKQSGCFAKAPRFGGGKVCNLSKK